MLQKKAIVNGATEDLVQSHLRTKEGLEKDIQDLRGGRTEFSQREATLQQSFAAYETGVEQWRKECTDRDAQISDLRAQLQKGSEDAAEAAARDQQRVTVHKELSQQLQDEAK